ncbi:glyoxylate/hydroxypyruvate reductase A [Aquincola sp. MAHUQ-54]|uniref:Glyoxylate/hydroxypyruvate reductase A n=1 Tax=Aquincola agrisoli TaxID=3119538 RepID=A0AAW9QBX1_9BURK
MGILLLSSPLPPAPFVDALRAAAPEVPVWTDLASAPADEVELLLAWRLKAGVLPRLPKLRALCSLAAGVDKLITVPDLPADLPLTRVVDPMQGVQIAQYVVAGTLQFTRDLRRYAQQQAQRTWERHPVRPAAQCRVGLLGLGAVGQAIARAFAPLGYPVAGWSRSPRALDGIACFHGDAQLPAMLAQTDILVCALPLTEATRGLLDHERLSQLPRGAIVVNVGRGEQMVEPDLRALLDAGHLGGAVMDVFDREPPPPDDWTWTHPRVLATPHIAAQASFETVAAQCVDTLRRLRAGQPPQWLVDRSAGY